MLDAELRAAKLGAASDFCNAQRLFDVPISHEFAGCPLERTLRARRASTVVAMGIAQRRRARAPTLAEIDEVQPDRAGELQLVLVSRNQLGTPRVSTAATCRTSRPLEDGDSVRLAVQRPAVPRIPHAKVWMAVRVAKLDWSNAVYRQVLAALAHWRAAGTNVVGLQIDFDAGTRHLERCGSFLADLRTRLPGEYGQSITGMLDWRSNGDPAGLHVEGSGGSAKFRLRPIRLRTSRGLARHELPRLEGIVVARHEQFVRTRHEDFAG